jgi:hypothetical protein
MTVSVRRVLDGRGSWAFACRGRLALAIAIALILLRTSSAARASVQVDYLLPATGQTARAEFSFLDANTLQILLQETTPDSSSMLTGPAATLVSLGFILPSGEIIGGSVAVGPGSASVGFDLVPAQLGPGENVSTEWGYSPHTLPTDFITQAVDLEQQAATLRTEAAADLTAEQAERDRAKAQRDAAAQLLANNPDPQMMADAADLIKAAEQDEADAAALHASAVAKAAEADALAAQATTLRDAAAALPELHFVGVTSDLPNPFAAVPPGANLVGPDGLDGPDAGLLADALAAAGLGVIEDSVTITLLLSSPFDAAQQADLLARALTSSIVQYGAGGVALPALSPAVVPAPASAQVFVLGGACLWLCKRLRGQRSQRDHRDAS